jgi:hypothetical protein
MKKIFNLALAVSVAALVSACGDKATTSSSKAIIDPTSKPLYSMRDGTEYGYELERSEADRTQGLKAKPLVMFRYLGRKGDSYQVVMIDGQTRHVFEATKPFEFAKIHSFYKDRYQGKELMRLADGTIAASAVRDAIYGHMKQWTRIENGVVTTLWVDGEKRSLVVEPAATSGVVQ